MLDLDPIRARLAAATPGPWSVRREVRMRGGDRESAEVVGPEQVPGGGPVDVVAGNRDTECAYVDAVTEEDAELIAHGRTDLEDLIAEVERLRAEAIRVEECETAVVNILEGERDGARAELAALRADVPLCSRDFAELAIEAATRMLRGRDLDTKHSWQVMVGAFGEETASVGLHEALIACDEQIPNPSGWEAKHVAAGDLPGHIDFNEQWRRGLHPATDVEA